MFVDGYNRRLTVSGCHVFAVAAGAFNAVGRTEAVWNPMFDPYGPTIPWSEINQTDKGPKTNDYPAEILFTDSLIHDIGQVEKQVAGVQISIAHRVTASKLSIYRVPRARINISEGAFGGHLIDRCDVFDTVQETGDHGSFNSWGRDRYWSINYPFIDAQIAADPDVPSQLPLLDMLEPNVIQNSRWRCDHGWDIDLDDGSSWYLIKNNLCLGGGIKLREGFFRTVENNLTPGDRFHPHVWFARSGDIVRSNIWGKAYEDIEVNHWGNEIDRNFFRSLSGLEYAQVRGLDPAGQFGDPQYQDPASLDFTTSEPVLESLGFVNFPMDQFGVQKASLKAIAEVPLTPELDFVQDPKEISHQILGAEAKSVVSLGEVSATGLPEMKGTIFLEVPENSDVSRLGLRNLDVIREIGGVPTDTFEEFVFAWARAVPVDGKIAVKLWRSQSEHLISFPPFPGQRLRAKDCELIGGSPSPVYDPQKDYLGAWTRVGSSLRWPAVTTPKPDSYLVLIEQAMMQDPPSTYQIVGLSTDPLTATTARTDHWEAFVKHVMGDVSIQQVGPRIVSLVPLSAPSGAVMNLREIIIVPSATPIDSDGDGFSDVEELMSGSDPNDPESKPEPAKSTPKNDPETGNPGAEMRVPTGDLDVSRVFEWSRDLSHWRRDVGVLESAMPSAVEDAMISLSAFFRVSLVEAPHQFFRLHSYVAHVSE